MQRTRAIVERCLGRVLATGRGHHLCACVPLCLCEFFLYEIPGDAASVPPDLPIACNIVPK
jgi:hypothetical protein